MKSTAVTIPTRVEDIDAEWLTTVLRENGAVDPDTSVTAVEHERIALGTGFASNLYRTHVSATGPAPTSVIVKLPSDAETYRTLGSATRMYTREVDYYAEIAESSPMNAPRAYFAARGDGDDGSFALVLEDLSHLEAADHLEGLAVPRVEAVIDTVAELHAWSMGAGAARLSELPIPAADDPILATLPQLGFTAGWASYVAHAREPLPDSFVGFDERMPPALPALFDELATPRALVHGDLRADNLFFDPEGKPTIVDYQLTRWANGVTDIAYVLSQGLRTEDRRGQDRRLIERYRRALISGGAEDVGLDTMWRHYQLATLMQLMYPLVALITWDDMPERAQDLCLTLVERGIATAVDISAFAALD